MKTYNKVIVEAPIDAAWKVMADDFNKNDEWMAQVFKTRSQANPEHQELGARICELTPTLDGLATDERIVEYDKENYKLVFTVGITNGGRLPVNGNIATVTMKKLSDNQTEVVWATTPDLKPKGRLLAPILKLGIQKSFREVLEEFKYFVENNQPHPRKIEAMKKMKGQ